MSDFKKMFEIDVNNKVEKKGQFSYLSWAWAWSEFVKNYPDATYEIIKNELNLPYFNSDAGGMVYTKVTAGGLTHEMWLPIMDYKNQAKKQFDMMDVNKTVMRCLVKNLAMFGLGLYIYAGEDLPEVAEQSISEAQRVELSKLIQETSSDLAKFNDTFGISTLADMPVSYFEKAKALLVSKKNKKPKQNETKS
ncbi:MAG: DUF1071 domain-containing protein [Sulfurimonas denitrificans]|nr:DUF1071 domain-containing protein [Sulfurimonas denitrificans]